MQNVSIQIAEREQKGEPFYRAVINHLDLDRPLSKQRKEAWRKAVSECESSLFGQVTTVTPIDISIPIELRLGEIFKSERKLHLKVKKIHERNLREGYHADMRCQLGRSCKDGSHYTTRD